MDCPRVFPSGKSSRLRSRTRVQLQPPCLSFLTTAVLALSPVSLIAQTPKTVPTFYRDVLPILQQHCPSCHRAGEIAPMTLETYEQVRPYARAIAQQTRAHGIPPWFADPCCGKFM